MMTASHNKIDNSVLFKMYYYLITWSGLGQKCFNAFNPNYVNVPVLSKHIVSILPASSTLSALLPIIPLCPSIISETVLQIKKNIGKDGGIVYIMQ